MRSTLLTFNEPFSHSRNKNCVNRNKNSFYPESRTNNRDLGLTELNVIYSRKERELIAWFSPTYENPSFDFAQVPNRLSIRFVFSKLGA
ncbi:MAG: hypothetical protein ACI9SI_001919 [Polaribacter sp.]|jgi:hypothetical protein